MGTRRGSGFAMFSILNVVTIAIHISRNREQYATRFIVFLILSISSKFSWKIYQPIYKIHHSYIKNYNSQKTKTFKWVSL